VPDISRWLLFIGIMAAFRKYSEFTLLKIPVKSNPLFHLKEKTSVRIKD
jgi:hypothetical protein